MTKWSIKKLFSPEGVFLKFDSNNNQLLDLSNKKSYSMINNIPIILPEKENSVIQETELHENLNTNFNYIDHYIKDAEVFDYSDKPDKVTEVEALRLHQAILKQIPKTDKTVLDVGCGGAWLAKELLKSDEKCEIISLDISFVNVNRAINEFPHDNHLGIVADVFSLPFEDASIDVAIASEIIEHISDPKLFIKKIVEKLKPGGILIITTPYKEKIEYYLCVHCNKPTPRNAHIHSFGENDLMQLLPDNAAKSSITVLNNKILLRTRLHIFLRYLPFGVWNAIDRFFNFFIKKPSRLLLSLTKS